MKPFLYELAENLYKSYKLLDQLTVVFPNRRAVIYFRKHLSGMLDKPAFSPRMITIEDFMADFSLKKVPDKLELIHRLYITYHNILGTDESTREAFDKFYFWGEMLLRDFDELDKYLVPVEQIFKDLTVQKELDASFDFLTDEQREFLKSFWSSFEENITENKKKFLSVWNRLFQLYTNFRHQLSTEGLAYEGMMHREVAENIDVNVDEKLKAQQIVFAGFNALTTAEEKILSYFVERHAAKVFWDIDTYYVHNNTQEAGRFFRAYQRHAILGSTFPQDVPANFKKGAASHAEQEPETNSPTTSNEKVIHIYGAAEPVSQAKVMAQILLEKLQQGLDPENTLIVLPDEKLLLPVLHGLSGAFEKLNVTMGFPLSNTPVFSIAELLVDLQISSRQDHFNHREVLALLGHPYVVAADPIAANVKRKEILSHNWVHIPRSYLATTVDLHRRIFQEVSAASMLDYLRGIITEIGQLEQINPLDKEYAFNFLKLLNRMDEVIGISHRQASIAGRKANQIAMKSFLRLLRQLIQTYKIPFTGEPLRGLQVMGVLETRNLDYKNVFILSMNEGAIPSSSLKGSYIPFNIRKAYGLPTVDHQDAIYAYLFYRVLQRAENIYLFYNSETDVLGQGEMSRYLQQLIYESGLTIEKKILHNPLQPRPITPITIPKTPEVLAALLRFNEGNGMFRGISPSALNNYVECRLRFYLRHVAGIKEPKEVEEDLDARVLGNFLHRVMELLYNGIREKKGNKLIEAADLKNTDITLDLLIDKAFIEKYRLDPSARVEYEGQRLVVREIVKRFAKRIIEMDKIYAPFTLEATEQGGLFHSIQLQKSNVSVLLNGKIDRVDRKDNILRVIDYKTGKDQLDFESIPSLFVRDEKRNKAAFQTMLYALLYKSSSGERNNKIVPGLINRMNLFDRDFKFGLKVGKDYIDDVGPLLPEFERHMTILLEELFSADVPFDQTTDVENCKYCAFKGICYRS
ncbi:MAG: PD-(D/E)XK nuclease family protein [Chryseolinea sp.]